MSIKLSRYMALILCSLLFQACNNDDEVTPNTQATTLDSTHQYFIDIAFGSEFESGYSNIRKWGTDVFIYLPETKYEELNKELDLIISELNPLLTTIQVKRVETIDEANYIIYLGDKDTYVNSYEPSAANAVQNNWGLFWIYWTAEWRINYGTMYVDVFRTQDLNCQKHLLREELTQSLGLMNDSYDYPTSIFYQEWTCGPEYADIDKELIKLLYDPKIITGMSKENVIQYLLSLQAI